MEQVHRLKDVTFTCYTEEEAKAISQLEVHSLLAFNKEKLPTEGGLYDYRMGVSSSDYEHVCSTCGFSANECQGHLGLLKLSIPVFNPFLFKYSFKLMKAKCSFCHKLRIPYEKAQVLKHQMALLKNGNLLDSSRLEHLVSLRILADSTKEEPGELSQVLKAAKTQYAETLSTLSATGQPQQHTAFISLRRQIIKDFWTSAAQGACPYCKAKQPKLTKENYVKIIRHPLKAQ